MYSIEKKIQLIPTFIMPIIVVIMVYISCIIPATISYFFKYTPVYDKLGNLSTHIFTGLILAPIIETLINQCLPVLLISKYKINRWLIYFLSATLFSLIHFHNVNNMIIAFLGGFIFTWIMHLRFNKPKEAILIVMVAHAIINLVSIVLSN